MLLFILEILLTASNSAQEPLDPGIHNLFQYVVTLSHIWHLPLTLYTPDLLLILKPTTCQNYFGTELK